MHVQMEQATYMHILLLAKQVHGHEFLSYTSQITIHTPLQSTPFTTQVHSSLAKTGWALGGGHLPSIAKAVFSHSELREHIMLKVMDMLNEECYVQENF